MSEPSPGARAAAPPVSSEPWRAAFESQCTAKLLRKAKRYAERRARKLRQLGGLADDYYAREIVQDVVADTFAGVLRWDPDVESLEAHVLDAVATRVHHDVVRARRFSRASLDDEDPEAAQATMAMVDATLLAAREASPATVRFSEEAFSELCELAAADADLQGLLGALTMGATSKDDVMFVTGMSDHEYRATRRRLERLIQRSPHREPRGAVRKTAHPAKIAQGRASSPAPDAGDCQVAKREPLSGRFSKAGAQVGVPAAPHRPQATGSAPAAPRP